MQVNKRSPLLWVGCIGLVSRRQDTLRYQSRRLEALFVIKVWICRRERRSKRPTKILFSVCVNLLIAYVIFVVAVDRVVTSMLCTAIAALMHFFFLATWFWMAAYGYDVYMSLVQVWAT